jgi:hypothetical protein
MTYPKLNRRTDVDYVGLSYLLVGKGLVQRLDKPGVGVNVSIGLSIRG